jgi:hypothetical protein
VRHPQKRTIKNLCRAPRPAHDKTKQQTMAPWIRRLTSPGEDVQHPFSCARVETHGKWNKKSTQGKDRRRLATTVPEPATVHHRAGDKLPRMPPGLHRVGARDGNGAPIPDPRWGFPPLGDTNGAVLVPAGSLSGTFPSPSGEAGSGTFFTSPSPFPVGDPD